MTGSQQQTLAIGQQAFTHFTHGLETGNWNLFIDMLTEDFTFWFPMGKYHGLNVGKDKFREFVGFVSETFSGGLSVTLDRVTSNETTVVFEFRDEGKMRGELYKNRIAISFDISGNQVSAYREYFGSDGKSN